MIFGERKVGICCPDHWKEPLVLKDLEMMFPLPHPDTRNVIVGNAQSDYKIRCGLEYCYSMEEGAVEPIEINSTLSIYSMKYLETRLVSFCSLRCLIEWARTGGAAHYSIYRLLSLHRKDNSPK